MLFRQLFDARSSTYTYLLADEAAGDAVLIDPVWEQFTRDAALLVELGLKLRYTIETHVHADHVTSASLLRERFGSRIVLAATAGAEGADVLVKDGDSVSFGAHTLDARATPGHTAGCLTWVSRDRAMAFTGDALLVRTAGRTDFQGGDARTLYRSVHEKIFTLPDACFVYPGHDYAGRTVTTVAEEKAHNARLGGAKSESDFAGTMANLGLPHPKQMDVAVPANLRCGRPDPSAGLAPPAEATWGPVVRTFAGIPQVEPEWVAENRDAVFLLDVREPAEFRGELGHVRGAVLIPLGELRAALGRVPKDRPVVAICRAGARSGHAALLLEKEGYARVANLAGGMVHWSASGLPVE